MPTDWYLPTGQQVTPRGSKLAIVPYPTFSMKFYSHVYEKADQTIRAVDRVTQLVNFPDGAALPRGCRHLILVTEDLSMPILRHAGQLPRTWLPGNHVNINRKEGIQSLFEGLLPLSDPRKGPKLIKHVFCLVTYLSIVCPSDVNPDTLVATSKNSLAKSSDITTNGAPSNRSPI